ncbi:MAG: ATP synthase F1 subunit delta [Dehalococcoidales bacterium]|nr:ATP synthase F1 subunit delta [Dehalococcoidales bacterium]
MPRKAYGRRYAQAIFEIALEKKELERWQTDLDKLAEAAGNEIFLAAMESPKIKVEKKTEVLKKSLGDINPLAMNLVLMLITRGGIGIIADIAGEYRRLLDAYRGIQTADVITAVPLDEKDKEKLAGNLGTLLGTKVVVKSEVDPEILGGIIARVNGKLLDGSTRSKLAALKRELVGTGRKS